MSQRAHVTSVEAIEEFRASLIVYVSKARPTLEEVSDEALRVRLWLENDQRTRWEAEVRRRTRTLEQAQQALFSAGISNLRDASDGERMAVLRARRALEEAEGKLKVVKQWSREFQNRAEPLTRQLDKLHTLLSNDLLKAGAFLANVIKALDAYADVAPPDMSGTPTGAAAGNAAGEAAAGPPPPDPAASAPGENL
jgi:hypothetical protein